MQALHGKMATKLNLRQQRSKLPTSKARVTTKDKISTAPPTLQTTAEKFPENVNLDQLRAFDLDNTYGPAIGMTRLERWERAKKLNLDPDPKIKELIQQHNTDSKYTQCIWNKTIVNF